jgi:hypothetical protein
MNEQSNPFAAIELLKVEVGALQTKIAHLCAYIDSHITKTPHSVPEEPKDLVVLTLMNEFYQKAMAKICSDVDAYVSTQHHPLKLIHNSTEDTMHVVQHQLSQKLDAWIENATVNNPNHSAVEDNATATVASLGVSNANV